MKIAQEQMVRLARSRHAQFLQRVRDFIAGRTGTTPDPAALEILFHRGSAHGLVSEQQLAGYMALAWTVNAWQAPSDPAWMAVILDDPHRLGDDKITALIAAAQRRE